MLPSARRAELSRHDFDNSYLSREALASVVGPDAAAPLHYIPTTFASSSVKQPIERQLAGGGRTSAGGPPGVGRVQTVASVYSRTTAALTTMEDEDNGAGRKKMQHAGVMASGGGGGGGSYENQGNGRYIVPIPVSFSRANSSHLSDESDFSDRDSLCSSVHSADSVGTTASKYATIRYSSSAAGQIWNMLYRLDDLVLEVKANSFQCRRLGARLGALKRPMVAVHKGRQTADQTVLAAIKELVTEAQHFMERFLDPEWWRKGAGRKEDSEVFRELTFRLGFLMQAPPGFQEQSQEEDREDRLKDYAELQRKLEGKLVYIKDEHIANQIMEVLRRVRIREAGDKGLGSSEIDYGLLRFDHRVRNLGSGGFGTVFLATLGDVPVSVKKLNNQHLKISLLEEMRRNVEVYHQLKYDFVVNLLGACTVRPNLCIVQERSMNNLFDLLHNAEEPVHISAAEKAAMLFDVARGLQFLHVKKIVHGNLKSTNVMVFENNRMKVCDFGLRGLREAGSILGSGSTAPLAAWTAPEVLDDQEPSVLSDVYSFGILIHEVLTQRVPFAGKGVAKIITAVVAKGHRPGYFELEEDTFPPSMVKLANMCWTQEPEARPKSLNVVVTQLGHIVNALGGDPRSLLDNQDIAAQTSKSSHSGQRQGSLGGQKHKTAEQRRIAQLEDELLELKLQQATGVHVPRSFGVGGGESEVAYPPPSVSSAGSRRQKNFSLGGVPEDAHGMFKGGHGAQGGGGESGWYWRRGNSQTDRGGVATRAFSYRSGSIGQSSGEFDSRHVGCAEERRTLRSLYMMTQGPDWKEQSGWETDDPDISCWYGVTCGEGGHVISLELVSNNLQGQIPPTLSRLSRLKCLILSDNKLEGHIPDEFGKLSRLVELDLSMNDLSGAIPAVLAGATSLERLYVHCNMIQGNVPRSLTKLMNLKVFHADWGELADTYPFKAYRKSTPPLTEAEVQRANSTTRKDARTRRNTLDIVSPLQQQRQQPSLRGGRGSVGQGPPGASFSNNPGFVTPVSRRGGLGYGDRVPLSKSRSERASPSGSGRMSYGDVLARGSSGVAPTAPYQGDDGMLAKAKAKAAPPKPGDKWKRAMSRIGKTLKEVIGSDLHPGYTEEVNQPTKPDAKTDGSSSKSL